MKLKEWMTWQKLTSRQVGDLLGVSRQAVERYVSGERVPRKTIMAIITRVTKGNVNANDFVEPVDDRR